VPVSQLASIDFRRSALAASLRGSSAETWRRRSSLRDSARASIRAIAGVAEMTSVASWPHRHHIASSRSAATSTARRVLRDVGSGPKTPRGVGPERQLPANRPPYRKVNPSDAPIMIVGLTSPSYTEGQMYDLRVNGGGPADFF